MDKKNVVARIKEKEIKGGERNQDFLLNKFMP